MFINFFYQLKSEGIPVSLNEWMTLMEALSKELAGASLTGFYYLARAVLVKSEAYFDSYDTAFAKYFAGIETKEELQNLVADWLKNAQQPVLVSPENRSSFKEWDIDELRRLVAEKLKIQDAEHHGGKKWIGTGGGSRHGHSGYHPAGVRIGGESMNQSAVKVAAKRQYRDLRDDRITGVRQFEVALKKLRQLSVQNEDRRENLDLEATVDATCKNAGWLKLVWGKSRHNAIKLVVLMDSGGSMNQYIQICSRLFTAASRASHFKDMRFYFFHNCVYDRLYTTSSHKSFVLTEEVLASLDSEYRLIIVGDADMSPGELTMAGGAIDWDIEDNKPGIAWLRILARHFPYAVWLNPISSYEREIAKGNNTVAMIRTVFPMFHLSPAGLEQAIKKLKARTVS